MTSRDTTLALMITPLDDQEKELKYELFSSSGGSH